MSGIEQREFVMSNAVSQMELTIGGLEVCSKRAEYGQKNGRPVLEVGRRLLDLVKIDHPIIQAPMGAHASPETPVAVCGFLAPVCAAARCASQNRPNGQAAEPELLQSCD